MDILTTLRGILARTPADANACPQVSRATLEAAVAEIEALRATLTARANIGARMEFERTAWEPGPRGK